ncbi:MAG: hypothetical protein NTY74_01375, partial [Ignavibacteriae bacterium]|nr:hypothetical protein [Ignavibacteriota bacterium]
MKTELLALLFLLLPVCAYSQIGGYAVSLDGIDDYISVQNSSSLNYSAFTVEAWVLYQDTDGGKVFGKSQSNGAVPGFNMGVEGNLTLTCECFESWGSSVNASSTKTLISGVWNHIAMTWSSGGYLCGYINGEQVINKASGSLSISNSNTVTIGKAPWTSINQGHFKGKIDEVRYWNVVRTQAEIKANMYREIGTNANLKVYYKMSDGSGTSLTDNSGNNYSGTMYNAPVWKTSDCFSGSRNALDFDGTDDNVSLSNGVVLGTTFTQEMWVYPTSSDGNFHGILGYPNDGGSMRPPCVYQHGTKIHFGFSNGSWQSYETGDGALTLNSWNHIAATFNGTTYTIYVNGLNIYSTTGSSGMTPYNNPQSSIGKLDNYFKGKIDEVRLWTVCRTAAEIRDNMMCTLAGNETGLAAYYRMDYYEGTTLYDMSSNARNGTLNNFALSGSTSNWVSSSAFNTWIGSESNTWSTAGNWSSGAAPVSSDNVGIYNWALGNECTLSGIPTVNILNLSSSATPSLSSNMTITGNLNLSKNIDLNGQTLTLGSSTVSPGKSVTGSYFLTGTGTVKRWFGSTAITSETGLYPVGVNTNNRNLTISGTPTTGGTISVAYTDASGVTTFGSSFVENGKTFIQRSNSGWTVTLADGFVCSNLSMAIRGDGIPGISNISDLNISAATGSAPGTYSSPTGTTSSPVINRTGLNTSLFNPLAATTYYFASTSNSPLPVTFSSFSSSVYLRDVKLNWKTSSEINNIGFDIERKTVESEWSKVGFAAGKGTTSLPTNYSFEDKKLSVGKYQYRLKQIDNNGNF